MGGGAKRRCDRAWPAEGRLGAEHKQRQATLAVIDLFDIVAKIHRAKSRLAELARTAAVGAARGSHARSAVVRPLAVL